MKKPQPKAIKQERRDQYTVVLEDIRLQVKGVAEAVAMNNEKMERGFKETDTSIGKLNEQMRLMRTEISLIRHSQITRDEFKALENRVFILEKKASK